MNSCKIDFEISRYKNLKRNTRDFPGNPVVKILLLILLLIPGQRTKIPYTSLCGQKVKEKKRNRKQRRERGRRKRAITGAHGLFQTQITDILLSVLGYVPSAQQRQRAGTEPSTLKFRTSKIYFIHAGRLKMAHPSSRKQRKKGEKYKSALRN